MPNRCTYLKGADFTEEPSSGVCVYQGTNTFEPYAHPSGSSPAGRYRLPYREGLIMTGAGVPARGRHCSQASVPTFSYRPCLPTTPIGDFPTAVVHPAKQGKDQKEVGKRTSEGRTRSKDLWLPGVEGREKALLPSGKEELTSGVWIPEGIEATQCVPEDGELGGEVCPCGSSHPPATRQYHCARGTRCPT